MELPRDTFNDVLHGAITKRKAITALGRKRVQLALHQRRLHELWPNVLVPTERMFDPATRAAAALLYAGPAGVLSGPTAAAAHGCTAADGTPVHVMTPYHRRLRSRAGLTVQQGTIRERDIVELDGLRVLTLDAAITELLCRASHRLSTACLAQAWHLLPEHRHPQFRSAIEQRLRQRLDRRGTRKAIEVLADQHASPTPRVPPQWQALGPNALAGAVT